VLGPDAVVAIWPNYGRRGANSFVLDYDVKNMSGQEKTGAPAASERRQEHGAIVRRLMRETDRAALATRLADGAPYASLVLLAIDLDATPLLLLSDLAEHSRNILSEPRVSLLIDGTMGLADPLTGPRATLIGRAEATTDARLLARFVARHPSAAVYSGFGDFRLYRVSVERAHLVAGFGRIQWVEGDVIRLAGDCRSLSADETEIIAHMNRDHADAIARIVGRGEGWRMTGIDPEGADFRRAGEIARAVFSALKWDAGVARSELVRLARAGEATPAGGA
jgi:heme iron utilization protein